MELNKGTIIFIHGNSSSPEVFKKSLESESILQSKIAINLLGHGNRNNDSINAEDFSIKAYSDDILKQLTDIDGDILLVGNSLGGHLAMEIAPKIDRLKGIVIFGTPPLKQPINFEEAFLPVPALQTFLTEHPTNKEITEAITAATYNKDVTNQLISDFKKANPLVRRAIAADVTNANFSNEFEFFTKLEIPKYIIVGKQDPTVNANYTLEVKNKCVGKCDIIEIDNCGHYPSIETPQEFNTILTKIA